MKSTDFLVLRQKCDDWLRDGQVNNVVRALKGINTAKIPRVERVRLAAIARRANLTDLALRILFPIADGSGTDAEMAEYGLLLHHVGSTTEGLAVLRTVDTKIVPEALLYTSFCHFSRWEYASAVPLLESYLNTPDMTTYAWAVGSLNLASAYVTLCEDEAAIHHLAHLEQYLRDHKYLRLLANALELRSQVDIRNQQFEKAESRLSEAAAILAQSQTFDQLFVEKWQSVLQSIRDHDARWLHEFREKARRRLHWESVREADFFLAKIFCDTRLFRVLHFGTPYANYRKRLQELGMPFDPGSEFLLVCGNNTRGGSAAHAEGTDFVGGGTDLGEHGPLLDLSSGELDGRNFLNPGKSIHRFLGLLFSDFYRPFRLGTIFSALFPQEKFDIFTTPRRIHQVVFRSRELLAMHKAPVQIVETDGSYHFSLQGDARIRIPGEGIVESSRDMLLERLHAVVGDRMFSAREARAMFNLPVSSLNLALKHGMTCGTLRQLGQGPKTQYQFVTEESRLIQRVG
ncbi:MAG: hypothetical protein C5B49_10705 [Bdellovibrio sp.]|nr:MAG: hypothetical protein C5B49_10705 [Bdellovibrio sp.]